MKVAHLPALAAGQLILAVAFGGAFVPLFLWHNGGGPLWPVLAAGYFAASFFLGLIATVFRILVRTS